MTGVPPLHRPRPPPPEPQEAPTQAPAHLIAVNCHPFHATQTLCAGLAPLARATALLRGAVAGRVEARIYWHGSGAAPGLLRRRAGALGLRLITRPHLSNGENLNGQIAEAAREGFAYFYRVDSDDTVFADRFVLQARLLMRGTCDICGTGLRYEPADGAAYDVIPPALPRARDFVENRFVLHPSMAFALDALSARGLQYWPHRLEDKALIAAADAAGLRVANLPLVLGTYRLGAQTRNRLAPKWLGLRLNLRFAWRRRAPGLLAYALFLFAAQVTLGSGRLRRVRQRLYGVDVKQESRAPQRGRNKPRTEPVA